MLTSTYIFVILDACYENIFAFAVVLFTCYF